MKPKPQHRIILFSITFCFHLHHFHSQSLPTTHGFTCLLNNNHSLYPCQTYVLYKATNNFLDLASIADLFSVSRLMISNPSNILNPSSPLFENQSLVIPISCSCNSINSSYSISYASLPYTFNSGDTMYLVSSLKYQYLTTYQYVELVNPNVIPNDVDVGDQLIFPIFCKCVDQPLLGNHTNFLISYVFQPNDTLAAVADTFDVSVASIVAANGEDQQPLDTIFVPVSEIPNISQTVASPSVSSTNGDGGDKYAGLVIGLITGLAVLVLLLVLAVGVLARRELSVKKKDEEEEDMSSIGLVEGVDESLMADVSDCLDRYRVFKIDELRRATNGFDNSSLIHGTVYKGCIDGEFFAVKRMTCNVFDDLKILQKVNHGNLVRLEGFGVDAEESTCYLVYEYIENGSLYSWLHNDMNKSLSWTTRLQIAIDVANGLQYIHEHTRPGVVHKNVTSSNILLDGNMRAKISNFGLAKSGCNAMTMHIVGTQGYIAPEYMSDGVMSMKMDVFAFGVILLELVTGKEAVDANGNVLWMSLNEMADGTEHGDDECLIEFVDSTLLEELDSFINVTKVAVGCLHKDPTRRPKMVDIVYALCRTHSQFLDASILNLNCQLLQYG